MFGKTIRTEMEPLEAQATTRRLRYLENEILAVADGMRPGGSDLAEELRLAAQTLEQVQESLTLMAQRA